MLFIFQFIGRFRLQHVRHLTIYSLRHKATIARATRTVGRGAANAGIFAPTKPPTLERKQVSEAAETADIYLIVSEEPAQRPGISPRGNKSPTPSPSTPPRSRSGKRSSRLSCTACAGRQRRDGNSLSPLSAPRRRPPNRRA